MQRISAYFWPVRDSNGRSFKRVVLPSALDTPSPKLTELFNRLPWHERLTPQLRIGLAVLLSPLLFLLWWGMMYLCGSAGEAILGDIGAVAAVIWMNMCLIAAGIALVNGRAVIMARWLQREGFCPSCGYQTADLPRTERGTVICPECSGEWSGSTGQAPRGG